MYIQMIIIVLVQNVQREKVQQFSFIHQSMCNGISQNETQRREREGPESCEWGLTESNSNKLLCLTTWSCWWKKNGSLDMLQLQNTEVLSNGAFAASESNGTNMVLSWRYYSPQAKVHFSVLSSDNTHIRRHRRGFYFWLSMWYYPNVNVWKS